ncbi:MAG TPA: hypothetical protein VLI06_00295 [Solimonas sp.]|nr:hypothetical protein [Solimonas sp.]
MIRHLSLLAAVLVVAGCASRSPCQRDTEYQGAQSLPPPATVEGLKLPESAAALRIPPAPAKTVALAEGECLQTPPRMAETPADKPADKPVEAAKQPQS